MKHVALRYEEENIINKYGELISGGATDGTLAPHLGRDWQ
jgi:hypothetical protein